MAADRLVILPSFQTPNTYSKEQTPIVWQVRTDGYTKLVALLSPSSMPREHSSPRCSCMFSQHSLLALYSAVDHDRVDVSHFLMFRARRRFPRDSTLGYSHNSRRPRPTLSRTQRRARCPLPSRAGPEAAAVSAGSAAPSDTGAVASMSSMSSVREGF